MKNRIITGLYVIAFIGGFLVLYFNGPKLQNAPVTNQTNQQVTTTEKNWGTKTDEQTSITVVITPLDLLPESAEWKFDIVMNTHSVELDQDMTKSAVLIDDQGKEYKPLRWEGGEAGGYHREGVLIFSQITPIPKSIELKISGIGNVERSFIW
ncbi:MAG: hypothetical protein AAB809_00250 [Patescibacteria group bacterium]